jgi:hypothetical protein
MKVLRLCPLVLLVTVDWRQVRALRSDDEKLIGNRISWYAVGARN